MNKLLKSVTSAIHTPFSNSNTNQNRLTATPDMIDLTLRVDMETWRYFENLDEDSRNMMSRVLQDYVQKQK